MNAIDLINMRGHQSFLENSINPIEIKIENDTVKKKKKTSKIYTKRLYNLYSLINGKIYQAIDIINLNEINDWEETSRLANVSFQSQLDNIQTQHFANNFVKKRW